MVNGKRCGWLNLKNPVYVKYHDEEWGVLQRDDGALYELFLLECFQAGLSWECVLNKRESFRAAFDGFDIEKVCAYGEDRISELMNNGGIIRNRMKIRAAVRNSAVFREIQREYGSFYGYICSFTEGRIIYEEYTRRTFSPLSDTVSADLKRRGMSFVGSVTVYSFLQAAGFISAHSRDCICYRGGFSEST